MTLVLSAADHVKANGNAFVVNGKWAGTAFASTIDINSDGIAARTFVVNAYGQDRFTSFEGTADSGLIALPGQGNCGPNAIELQAFGTFTFRGRNNDALFADVPFDAPHLCFDPANPDELLPIRITGGTSRYAGATGTGTLRLHDIVRLAVPVIIGGVAVEAPVMIETQGEFSLSVQ